LDLLTTTEPHRKRRKATKAVAPTPVVTPPIEYKARPGHGINDHDAAQVGAVLDALTKRDGGVSPEALVDEARPLTSPAHKHFTWDDGAAAEAYRREEARHLIRAIVIVRVAPPTSPKVTVTVPAFESVTTAGERTYQPVADVMSKPSLLAQVEPRFVADLTQMRARYAAYIETTEWAHLRGFWAEVDSVIAGGALTKT
jgi:hypothetical protein